MNRLVEEIIKPILEANSKIKKVVGIYGGRFQPFGPHHLKTYKWLTKQVDVAYITTSNIKKPPRHPMNFKEKVRHMSKMGVPSNKIIEEKSPYVAKNLEKKFDSETTAFVYVFGAKDAGRLGGKYFQDYKKSKGNIKGYKEHGYYLVAPHVSISVGGKEVSGTTMRELLGSDKYDDKERAKLFKKMFGYYNKGIFNMMTNKFKKLFEDTWVFKPTKMKKLKKKWNDGKGKELLKGGLEEDWLNKGSKKDRAIKLKLMKLYSKAFKQMPGSPAQKKVQKEIEKLRNQLSEYDIKLTNGYPTDNDEWEKWLKARAEEMIKKRKYKKSQPYHIAGENGVTEGVDLPIEIGDTVRMGKFKNKKVVVKSIDWNEKGDLLINGRPALKFRIEKKDVDEKVNIVKKSGKDGGDYRDYDSPKDSDFEEPYKISDGYPNEEDMKKIKKRLKRERDRTDSNQNYQFHPIEEFLTTIDMSKIIKEASSTGGAGGLQSVDSGPSLMFKNAKHYEGRGQVEAEKLGWTVIDYIMSGNTDDLPPSEYELLDGWPMGPHNSVSYLPAGIGTGKTPNNQENLTGTKGYDKWVRAMKSVATEVGFELMKFTKQDRDTRKQIAKDTTDTLKTQKEEEVTETVFTEDWWKKLIVEVKYDKPNFEYEWKEAIRYPEFKKVGKDGWVKLANKGYTTKYSNIKDKLGNVDLNFDGLEKPKKQRFQTAYKNGTIEIPIVVKFSNDDYDLVGGNTRLSGLVYNKKDPILWVVDISNLDESITEVSAKTRNFKQKLMRRGIKIRYDKEAAKKDLMQKYGGQGEIIGKKFGLRKAYYAVPKKGFKKDTKPILKINKKEMEKLHKDKVLDKGNLKVVFSESWWKEQLLLTEGGAYGHMAHPFDDKDLTFGDLKKIIELGLGGQLNREDNVTEKLDGQNIMISWKDGKLIAARNKGHIKNGGKTALTTSGIASKFKGRGDIRNAFVYAMKDLEKSIKGLSDKQKEKIFNNGYNFMNMEVMWPKSANVIDYDIATLIFHGALKYDDKGNVKGEVKGSGRILAGMIEQINQHIQKKYSIGKPQFLKVPKHQDFGKMKSKFLGRLNKLKSQFGLKDNDTLGLYHQMWWEQFILKQLKKISPKVLEGLVKRWAFFDKSYTIPMMRNDLKEHDIFLQWALDFDKKNHAAQVKKNMKPFEELFFEVGAEVLKNVKGFIAASPDKAVQGIVKRLDKAIANVRKGGDLKKLNTLKLQLDKLNAIGGTDAIVPSEGLVFKYKGKTYKFTGAFAPINQITGLISF